MKNERIKHKLHKFKVEEHVFKSSIFVFTNVNESNVSALDKVAAEYNAINHKDDEFQTIKSVIKKGAIGVVKQLGNHTVIICFSDRKPQIGTIVHECLHATYKLLSTKGIELTDEGVEETYCYFLEFLVKEIWEKTR